MAKPAMRAIQLGVAFARRLVTTESAPATAAAEAGGGRTSKRLYRRLSALGAHPGTSVAETMDGWLKEKKVVTQGELMKFVKELRKYKQHKNSLELMEWMEAKGMSMSLGNHAVRLDLISKVKGIDMAESYFSSLPESDQNQLTYCALLNGYVQLKMADKAIALYEKMKELNFTSSTLVQNNLMTLYMKLGQFEKIPDILLEMKENNIPPDNFTYCVLMKSYASLNDIESVEKVIQEMEEGGIKLEWSTYTNLAAHYNSAGLFQKTESALKKSEEVMDKQDRIPFHFLISLYAGAGNSAEVKRVWKSLKAAFAKPTNKSYLVMLHALDKLDDIDALKQCFEEWECAYGTYDVRLANVTIGAYLRKGLVNEAENIWEKAVTKGYSDLFTFDLFINCYLDNCQVDLALKSFNAASKWLEKEGLKPKKEIVHKFLKHFEELKDVEGMESFYNTLKKLNYLDVEVYESLLQTYVAVGKTDPSLEQKMKDDGIKIRPETMELLKMVSIS
ncbi:pentatricopeptide repeat-containing protein At4g01990, mitochondrial [Typha angustifolia]|uniref:pentatricopeptide repeat-containing protein At4g01990, mitochondrial n=1 Tax=Typha angustifolia TaxID=59011 RepID=UPI003C2DF347